MAFNIMAAIVMIYIMWIKFIPVECQTLCTFKEETIIRAGFYHYEFSILIENDNGQTFEIMANSMFDIYKQTFAEMDLYNLGDIRAQAGFFITECDDEPDDEEDLADCQTITDYKQGFNLEPIQQFVLRFFFIRENGAWIRKMSSEPGKSRQTDYMDLSDPQYKLWPPEWEEYRVDQTIMGACTYSEKDKMFVYVINGRDDSTNAFVYNRSLKAIREDRDWTVTEIPNTAGKKFTSVFYWFLNGNILAQVIKDKHTDRGLAQIYEYIPNDKSIVFGLKPITIKQLWGCRFSEPSNNNNLFLIIGVITVVVVTFTIIILCYFCAFILCCEKRDPIFGLQVKY